MPYGVYVADEIPDPKIGDGQGYRLIVMDTSTGGFPDISWLRQRFPHATVALKLNNRNVQAEMCAIGIGIAVLPRPIGDQTVGIRRIELNEDPPSREIWIGYHRDLRRLQRLRAFVDIAIRRTRSDFHRRFRFRSERLSYRFFSYYDLKLVRMAAKGGEADCPVLLEPLCLSDLSDAIC